MKKIFKILDKDIINSVLDNAEYGTLAVSINNEPYAVPVNFVRMGDDLYFHGALSNKKMKILAQNQKVSFSVVENYSLIASYFSSDEGLACPATQFFKSVSIDGEIKLVKERESKAEMFEALMKKLQPEGGYKNFDDKAYDKALKATAVVKITPRSICCKFKFGQHLDQERFDMIVKHLEERGKKTDLKTVDLMREVKTSS